MPKKLQDSLYGDSLLIKVIDHLSATDQASTVKDINLALAADQALSKKNIIFRIRRCLKALLANGKVILIEEKSKYKTPIHLYKWIKQ